MEQQQQQQPAIFTHFSDRSQHESQKNSTTPKYNEIAQNRSRQSQNPFKNHSYLCSQTIQSNRPHQNVNQQEQFNHIKQIQQQEGNGFTDKYNKILISQLLEKNASYQDQNQEVSDDLKRFINRISSTSLKPGSQKTPKSVSDVDENQSYLQSQEHRAKLLKMIIGNNNMEQQHSGSSKSHCKKHPSTSSSIGQNYIGIGNNNNNNNNNTFTNQSYFSSSHEQSSLNHDQQSYYTASTVSPERQRNPSQIEGQEYYQSQNYQSKKENVKKKDNKVTNTERESLGRMVDLVKICGNQQVKSGAVPRFQANTGTFKVKKNMDEYSNSFKNQKALGNTQDQSQQKVEKNDQRKKQRMQLVDQVKELLVSLQDRVAFLQRKGPINIKKTEQSVLTPKSQQNNIFSDKNNFRGNRNSTMIQQNHYSKYMQKVSSPLRQPIRSRSSSPQQHHHSQYTYQSTSNYKTKTDTDRKLNYSQILSTISNQLPSSKMHTSQKNQKEQRPFSKDPKPSSSDLTSSDIVRKPYQDQINRLNNQIHQIQNVSHKSKKQIRLLQGQLIMIKQEKRRHIQQNALEKEEWLGEKQKLLKSLQQSNKQNDELKASNQHLKNQVENAKQSVSNIENQVKRLRSKFEEELKQQKKLINTQQRKEKVKDQQHRERVKELKSKYAEGQNQLRQLQEKYKIDTARFQALLAAQRQTIESQKDKIKQLQLERKEQEQRKQDRSVSPFQYNTETDKIQNKFASYYQTPKIIPQRPKSAAGYTTASSYHSSNNTTGDNLPKIYLNSKSPKDGILKAFPKPPTASVAKSQELQIKKLQNKLMLGQSRQNKFFANRSMIEESKASSKSPQMGDNRQKSILKRNVSSGKHVTNLIESNLCESKKKFLYMNRDEQIPIKELPRLRSNSVNNNANNVNTNYKSVQNRGRQLYSVQIQDLRCKSTPKHRSSPLREPRKIKRIDVPSIPRCSIDEQKRNHRQQELYKNLQEEGEVNAKSSLIKLRPIGGNVRNPDESFTFALNSRDDLRAQKMELQYNSQSPHSPLRNNNNNGNGNQKNLKQNREKLKGVENQIFILQREIAGLNYLSRQGQESSSQELREKQRRLDVVRLQRDGILMELF